MNPALVNIDAEQALLGTVLGYNDSLANLPAIEPCHFSEPVHARIFEAAAALIRDGRLASPLTLRAFFETDQTLEQIGGVGYLARLIAAAAPMALLMDHARLVRELWARREAIRLAERAAADLEDLAVDVRPEQAISEIADGFARLADGADGSGASLDMAALLTSGVDDAAFAYQHYGRRPDCISTGIADLDKKIGGFAAGDLVVLGGRPSMGKSGLALQFLMNVAHESPAHFQSLEMSAVKLSHRLLSMQTHVPFFRIGRGNITEPEFIRIAAAARELQALPIIVDDADTCTIAAYGAKLQRLKMRRPAMVLAVADYLGLFEAADRGEKRIDSIGSFTRGLKRIAKRLGVCVLALHQLSRAVESRDNKRPQMSDLRESGSVEQDADIVLFIHRPEYYLARDEPPANTAEHIEWEDEMRKITGVAEIVVAKNRNGPTGIVEITADLECNRFAGVSVDATSVRQEAMLWQ